MPFLRAVAALAVSSLAVAASVGLPADERQVGGGAEKGHASPAASGEGLRGPVTVTDTSATIASSPTSSSLTTTKAAAPKAAKGKPTPTATPTPTPTATPTPAPTPSPTASTWSVPVGVTIPWGPLDPTALAETTAVLRHTPAYLEWYTGWGEAPDVAKLQAVTDAGAVPVVTWEPWDYTAGVTQPAFALDRITAGDHDAYLTQWADALAAWDHPMMLRLAHEMNGTWYPWAAGVNGNTATDYVAAWRHVHDLFAARGADDVSWVWAPNVVYPGSTPLTELYPGDAYVDVLGVDGYNWGTSVSWGSWVAAPQVFTATLTELRTLAPATPMLITETASSELGGSKAAWVDGLITWAAGQDVRGVIWFDEDKETDWRMASSATSAAAFGTALYRSPL